VSVEIRELARIVIEAGGNLDDLKRLAARWNEQRHAVHARTLADLTNAEWMAAFPGSIINTGVGAPPPRIDPSTAQLLGKKATALAEGPLGLLRGLPAPVCRYEHHRPTDWRPRGSVVRVCGICHPPAEGLDIVRADEHTNDNHH
jgi:hypothetical protein